MVPIFSRPTQFKPKHTSVNVLRVMSKVYNFAYRYYIDQTDADTTYDQLVSMYRAWHIRRYWVSKKIKIIKCEDCITVRCQSCTDQYRPYIRCARQYRPCISWYNSDTMCIVWLILIYILITCRINFNHEHRIELASWEKQVPDGDLGIRRVRIRD